MNGCASPLQSSLSSGGKAGSYWVDEADTLHENYQALIFIGSEFLGEFPIDPGAQPELCYRRGGVAYFCPACGEVWARLVWVNSRGEQQLFDTRSVACDKHPDQWNIPGSLLTGELFGLLDLLPRAVLLREVILHFNYYGD